MQIKTTMRCNFVSIKVTKIKIIIPSVDKDGGPLELSYILVEMQNGTATLENSVAVSYQIKPILSI